MLAGSSNKHTEDEALCARGLLMEKPVNDKEQAQESSFHNIDLVSVEEGRRKWYRQNKNSGSRNLRV